MRRHNDFHINTIRTTKIFLWKNGNCKSHSSRNVMFGIPKRARNKPSSTQTETKENSKCCKTHTKKSRLRSNGWFMLHARSFWFIKCIHKLCNTRLYMFSHRRPTAKSPCTTTVLPLVAAASPLHFVCTELEPHHFAMSRVVLTVIPKIAIEIICSTWAQRHFNELRRWWHTHAWALTSLIAVMVIGALVVALSWCCCRCGYKCCNHPNRRE